MCIYGYEGSGVSFQYKSFLGWGSADYRILRNCYFWVWKNNLAQVKQVSQDRKKRRKKYNFKRWCMWCCKRKGGMCGSEEDLESDSRRKILFLEKVDIIQNLSGERMCFYLCCG